jgi:hypothetical protein
VKSPTNTQKPEPLKYKKPSTIGKTQPKGKESQKKTITTPNIKSGNILQGTLETTRGKSTYNRLA